MKTLKLLLIEDDLEDELLLSEALLEIEEKRQWCNWRAASVTHVEQLAEALDCLRQQSFDAVLLNLSLPDSPVLLDSFHEVNAISRGAPIVVLADEEDENLAHMLLREGAQDVLLKSELECTRLARSLRYGIERHRRMAMVCAPCTGSSSGALTRSGFLTIATHYLLLCRLSQVSMLMASIEIRIEEPHKETLADRESRELLLLRAAEVLSAAFQPPALIGRLGNSRFGLITAGLTETTLEALLNRAALAIENGARSHGRHPTTVRFSVTEIHPDSSLEEMLGQDGDEFAARAHRRAKTVMLAD